MIGVAPAKKKHLKSTGPKGELDYRRWVIITLRNNGAEEAQFPLPVTVNSERVAFGRDEPVIAPAYYLDTLDNCILPKYEKVASTDTAQNQSQPSNQVKSEDDAMMIELKYQAEVTEIPMEYQTVDGIVAFAEMLKSPECPEEYEHLSRARFGQSSFNNHNYNWSKQNEAKSKKGGKETSAKNNSQ